MTEEDMTHFSGKFCNFLFLSSAFSQWCFEKIFKVRPRMFKSRIALCTGWITIQWISIWETICIIHRTEIYLVDNAILLLTNWGLDTHGTCCISPRLQYTGYEHRVHFIPAYRRINSTNWISCNMLRGQKFAPETGFLHRNGNAP